MAVPPFSSVLTDDPKDFGDFCPSPAEDEFHSRPREERWSFHDVLRHYIFTRLGGGTVNNNAAIRALKSRNYDDWPVIEQAKTNVDPTSIARENRLYLENVLKVESE
jgi:sugar phosphate isomerase/epimerase